MVGMYSDNSKYIVEEMESTNDDDYELIRNSFEGGTFKKNELKTHKIYRVKQRNRDETSEHTIDNMLLFHGTRLDGVTGILEEGFRPSTRGTFGPGVYLTASPSTAYKYSVSETGLLTNGINRKHKTKKVLLRMLVNEVLESEKLKVGVYQKNKTHQFARYNNTTSTIGKRKVTGNNSSSIVYKKRTRKNIQKKDKKNTKKETFGKDSNGRQIKTSRATERDNSDHYVCNEHFVIPRYLIEFYPKASL